MLIAYEIEGRVLIIRQNDEKDLEAYLAVMAEANADERLQPGTALLWDGRRSRADASADTLKLLIHRIATSSDKLSLRCAMLVSSDLQYGVSRMLSVYAEDEGMDVAIFRSEEQAMAWCQGES